MNRNIVLTATFAGLLALVGFLIYLNFFAPAARLTPAPERNGARAAVRQPLPGRAGGAANVLPAGQRAVPAGRAILYFQAPDIGLLYEEQRDVALPADGNGRARVVLEELAKGPNKDLLPTLPPGARVREVYFDAAGTAYIDFTRELRDNLVGGSAEELMTVESIVHTVTRNVPQATAVRLLIDGRPVTTLAGHVDLERALRPTPDRLAATP